MKKKNEIPEGKKDMLMLNEFTEKDDIMIDVNLLSNGLTGQGWVNKFETEGRELSEEVKKILTSQAFVPTKGVIYKLVIIRGKTFEYGGRTVSTVREYAYSKGFFKARLEIACLFRDLLSDEKMREMRLYSLVVVSTHAKKKNTKLLMIDIDGAPNTLMAHCVKEMRMFRRSTGFVFSTEKTKNE